MYMTDEQLREHKAMVQQVLDEFRRQQIDSRTLCGHLDRGWVRWSAERRAQQRYLLGQLWDEDAADVPRATQAFFLAGNDVGGKVKYLADPQSGLNPDEYLIIDAYRIDTAMARRNMIPHVEGCAPLDLKVLVREESCQLAERLLHRAMSEGCNVMLVKLFRETPTQECDPGADTVRLIVERFQAGGMEFSALVDALVCRWRERPERILEPATWGEIYRRAEQSADDDDLVWISVAEDVGTLSVEHSEEIFAAIEAAAGEQEVSSVDDDAMIAWRYYTTPDAGLVRVADGRRGQRYWGSGVGWLASSPSCEDWADIPVGSRLIEPPDVAAAIEVVDHQPGGTFRQGEFLGDTSSEWSVEQAQQRAGELEASIADTNNYDNWYWYQSDRDELARVQAFIADQPFRPVAPAPRRVLCRWQVGYNGRWVI